MSTYDTTFVGTTDGLTADNLLKPAKGEIFLLERDANNFLASQSTITDNLLSDLEGNGVVAANEFTVDVTVPTILSAVRVSNTLFTVTLSESMDPATVTKSNAGGFVVHQTGSAGTTYAVSAVAPGVTANKVTLTVASTAVSGDNGITIKYTAGGNGTAKDSAGNVLATNATGVTVAAWDTTAPTMIGVTLTSSTILDITFSEALDTASITKSNAGGFVVTDTTSGLVTYAVSAIAPTGVLGTDVRLTVADYSAESGNGGVTITYVAGGNGTVADVAGNLAITDATGLATE